ncbi:uncharacterized protein LOC112602413 [Melanaphis sacchari]|uniref:uncharacterized protein LOC112602413 n=1 Tax=Melanaphis sacchari TaxID=742174 RepID=UPI000DC14314|nr:uncharacterized protein LOC112602413 [Melanaphis sacchari]
MWLVSTGILRQYQEHKLCLKYKRTLFLETELYKISSMVYARENMLVIESKTHEGCRVLLNRKDLIQLQYLEWCIFETITQKSNITQPAVLKQFEIFLNYIDVEFTKVDSPPKNHEEMVTFIKNLSYNKIIRPTSTEEDMGFINQLRVYVLSQLARHWAQRWSGEQVEEEENSPEVNL